MEIDKLNEDGYLKLLPMSEKDLTWLRDCVSISWIKRINHCYPKIASKYCNLSITKYHEIRHDIDHEYLWNKRNRLFSDAQVKELKKRNFYIELQKKFGNFQIAEQTYDGSRVEGREEIYWRLVSPGFQSDVGGVHADHWFHEVHKLNSVVDQSIVKTLKVWIPLYCEPQKNGLLVSVGSHKKKWSYEIENRNGIPYPAYSGNIKDLNLVLVDTVPGEALIFGEYLMHAGAVNNGLETRVSIEITMKFTGQKN